MNHSSHQIRIVAQAALIAAVVHSVAIADTRKTKSGSMQPPPSKPLILSPSDTWTQQQLVSSAPGKPHAIDQDLAQLNDKQAQPPVNLGCDVDVRPQYFENERLSNRLVGECRLGYNY